MEIAAALFLMGLASGLHCLGMCGGIATAFPANKLLFNAGRISTYGAFGLAAGSAGSMLLPAQPLAQVGFSVALVLVALQIAGWRAPLRRIEGLGLPLWRRVQPFAVRFSRENSFLAGMAWGCVPCGLVYAAAAASAFARNPLEGAAGMLAFGAGTLPWLLAAGVLAARLRGFLRWRPVRFGAASVVGSFGVWGLVHLFHGVHP